MKIITEMSTGMIPQKISGVLIILFLTIKGMNILAQPALTVYADVSKNVLSDAATLRSVIIGSYSLGNYQVNAALRTNLVNGNNTVLSGYAINGTREFRIKNFPFSINGFWLWIAPSEILKESDYGCFISMKQKHIEMKIGTSFRTYGFRNKAIDDYELEKSETKIHENFNLIYSFAYNLRPSNSRWNTGVTLTNIDYFLINQETNPYLNLHFSCRVNSPVKLFAEAWYKNAGFLNMSSNYFGYAIKIGLIWKIN
jgi:hypothetical protein